MDNFFETPEPIRQISLPNGRTLSIKKEGQYGFFRLHLDKGQVPDVLVGDFTSIFEAEKAAKAYYVL